GRPVDRGRQRQVGHLPLGLGGGLGRDGGRVRAGRVRLTPARRPLAGPRRRRGSLLRGGRGLLLGDVLLGGVLGPVLSVVLGLVLRGVRLGGSSGDGGKGGLDRLARRVVHRGQGLGTAAVPAALAPASPVRRRRSRGLLHRVVVDDEATSAAVLARLAE